VAASQPQSRQGELDATTLGRTAAVVRHRGHVLDLGDLDTQRIERTHGRLAAGARAFDAYFPVLHAILHRGTACGFGGDLCSKRSRLTRALEAGTTRGSP